MTFDITAWVEGYHQTRTANALTLSDLMKDMGNVSFSVAREALKEIGEDLTGSELVNRRLSAMELLAVQGQDLATINQEFWDLTTSDERDFLGRYARLVLGKSVIEPRELQGSRILVTEDMEEDEWHNPSVDDPDYDDHLTEVASVAEATNPAPEEPAPAPRTVAPAPRTPTCSECGVTDSISPVTNLCPNCTRDPVIRLYSHYLSLGEEGGRLMQTAMQRSLSNSKAPFRNWNLPDLRRALALISKR